MAEEEDDIDNVTDKLNALQVNTLAHTKTNDVTTDSCDVTTDSDDVTNDSDDVITDSDDDKTESHVVKRDYRNDVTNDKKTPLCNAENKSDYNEAINHHLEVVKESCNFNEEDYNNVTSSEKVLNCSENDACAVNMKTIQNYEIDTLSVNVDRCKLGSQD